MTGEGSLFDVPPAAIGRFRVLHQIGAGTCGPVFRAVDPGADTTVAIKLFTTASLLGRSGPLVDGLARLIAELPRATAAVAPLDAGLHGRTPYFATSYAAGDSLDVALNEFGPALLVDVVPRLRALAASLDAAAGRGLLHGALHPRDVIVSDSQTMLTGLGVWPVLASLGEHLPVRRPYRSPELGPLATTAAGDQFSLAVLAYEWATGRRAPSAFVPGDMATVPGADRAALALVFGRALHADPERRYRSCHAFVEDLAAVAVSETTARSVVEPSSPTGHRRSRAAADLSLPLDLPPAEQVPVLPLQVGAAASPADAPGVAADTSPILGRPEVGAQDDGTQADRDRQSGGTVTVSGPSWATVAAGEVVGGPNDREFLRGDAARARPTPAVVRLAAAAFLGVALGVGVGYLVWGRGRVAEVVPATATEPVGAPEPLALQDPEIVPTGMAPAPSQGATAPSTTAAPALSATAVTEGSLLVRSTPAGATVFVDDERRGVTPVTLSSVALGTRVVRVQRDGFMTEARRIALTADRPSRSVEVRLQRAPVRAPASEVATPRAGAAPSTGSLVVESRPAGAAVTVDGRPAGTTPLTLDRISPGPHTVTMRLPGFRPTTTTVRVVAAERARAAASLTPIQEP